jgi:voltage-gated potassium channel
MEKAETGDWASRVFDITIMSLIFANVFAVILETIPQLSNCYGEFFNTFELVSVIIFSIEYILRLWTCTAEEKYKRPILGRIRFIKSPMALVDFVAILPFYLPMVIDLRFLRALRLFRLFRLFKMARYSQSLQTFGNVFKAKKEELVITICVGAILLVFASSVMYYAEHNAQPEAFSSIPSSMWWGIATLTTVGYGDVFPVTNLGKFFGAIIAFLGIGMFALPTGILASGFAEELEKMHKKGNRICPHCGINMDVSADNKKPG